MNDKSLSELESKVFIRILLHNLCHSQLEIFLSNVNSTLSKGKHTSFSTDGLGLSTRTSRHQFCNLFEVDSAHKVHFTRVNLKDIAARILVRVREFNLTVNSTRT